jgi:carbon storage regulator
MALVLSRCVGEKIEIGDNVVIEVIQIDRGQVKLAIVAPRGVKVLRGELARRKRVRDGDW